MIGYVPQGRGLFAGMRRRVRINAVAPGPVDTDLFRAGKTEEAKQRSAALSPSTA